MRVRGWILLSAILAVLWLFVGGVELAADAIVGGLLVGLAVGIPVSFLFRRLYPDRVDVGRGLRAVPYAVLYGFVFVRETVVANLDVAYRVLSPGPPIEPEVILVPLRVRTNLGITTIANSITITPGTITLDHDEAENALFVHVIDGRDIDAVIEPIRTWEDYALVIFDEELEPGDPRPEITVDAGVGDAIPAITVADEESERDIEEDEREGDERGPGGEDDDHRAADRGESDGS